MKRVYIEKQKELKIYGDYDVVVVGGGTAGVFAAISATEQGKKTLIVEQFGALGGSATVGLVCPLMHSGVAGNPYNSYIGSRVAKKLIELGATR
ncbi:MAG: FAD-dependent oxidoreductase, partial [Clostridia bacterium]|nr:FAD-dependent oxidoreductase [Clostridia bacterium]